ncbi:class I SAM-dependent methyltransferase [Actinomadura logoneensis]|uniref:Class I SAM-dependent methyltransferase n=1 Tax=Actinomadura logoneensis TaxID=2293572 RepID=A0A372JR61_9ACTN|nr:class I SAM-dependent methyltransferase [Actinomadura logoneensis]RFU42523.1 class I SAM-dependent methyltransferase [Actinomadura logoneensis]
MTGQIVNTAQAEAWNGGEGAHWAAHYDRYDRMNAGINEHLLEHVRADDDVLDIGCGNGQLTRLAAGRAASALGVDLSEPMLARARERAEAEGVANVRFVRADAQVHPFEPASADLVLSRFGVMFFADPVAAFANIGRALRPGGRLAFACMTSLAGTDAGTILAAVMAALGTGQPPTGPDGTGPTSFADPRHTEGVLAEAGYTGIGIRRVEAPQHWGRDAADAADFFCGWGPIVHAFGQAGPDAVAAAKQAVRREMARFEGPEGVRTRGTAWLVTAHYDGR